MRSVLEKLTFYCNTSAGPDFSNVNRRGEFIIGSRISEVVADAGHLVYFTNSEGESSSIFPENRIHVNSVAEFVQTHGYDNPVDVAMFFGSRDDVASFPELQVRAKIYLWQNPGPWPTGGLRWGKNEYVTRCFRDYLELKSAGCDIGDRHVLLAVPFGKEMGTSKFKNKRIGCAIKFLFHKDRVNAYGIQVHEIANKFIEAIIKVSNELGTGITIFCSEQFTEDPTCIDGIKRYKILEKLSTVKDVKFVRTCGAREFIKELCNCSIVFPLPGAISGCAGEAIFYGLTPIIFQDSFLFTYGGLKDIALEMTGWKMTKDYSSAELENKFRQLLTDETYYNSFLNKLQVHFKDHTNDAVLGQFNNIIAHAKSMGTLK